MIRKLIITINLADNSMNDLANALSEHHCADWEDSEKPPRKECIGSLRNECNSWLNDLNIIHSIEYKE